MTDPAVLDTNIWLDWLVFDDPGITGLRTAVARGSIALLASPWMRDELESVLARPLIRTRLPEAPARIALFDSLVSIRDAAPPCRLVCTDPADQAFIDLACHHRARWLITKDRALLRLARAARARHAVAVLTPAGFAAAYNPPFPDPREP
jgi:putative PIN family toxin of toxin-antitoxin system